MKTRALIEKTKDGGYSIFTPDVDHTIIGVGATLEVAKRDFENSVAEMQAAYTERGFAVPPELLISDFEYLVAYCPTQPRPPAVVANSRDKAIHRLLLECFPSLGYYDHEHLTRQ